MIRNTELRSRAYEAMEGKWGLSALITFVFSILGVGVWCVPTVGTIVQILLLPMFWAYCIIFLRLVRKEEIAFEQIFDGFSNQYLRYLGTLLLEGVYVLLWMLLLIVPGIIKGCSYAMTPFILKDEEVSYDKAIDKSMVMMEGYKMKFFLMNLYFIGWGLLCILTFGIGFFWLYPYIMACNAAFYEDVKADYEERNGTAEAVAE